MNLPSPCTTRTFAPVPGEKESAARVSKAVRTALPFTGPPALRPKPPASERSQRNLHRKRNREVASLLHYPSRRVVQKKMPPQKTLILSGFFAWLGPKKVHGSFIDAKPDFWPYVGPEVATAHFSPNFESDFRKYFKDFSAAAVSMRSQERFFIRIKEAPLPASS